MQCCWLWRWRKAPWDKECRWPPDVGKRQRNRFYPRAFREEHSLLTPSSYDFWPPDNTFVLFLATKFVTVCYSSDRKWIHPPLFDVHIAISSKISLEEGLQWLKMCESHQDNWSLRFISFETTMTGSLVSQDNTGDKECKCLKSTWGGTRCPSMVNAILSHPSPSSSQLCLGDNSSPPL